MDRRRRTNAEIATLHTAIVAAVAEDEPVSLRGVFYRVTSVHPDLIPKSEQGYRVVQDHLLQLRRAGVVANDSIVDGSRIVERPDLGWSDPADYLLDAANGYRRSPWWDQPARVYVLSEKDAITAAVGPVIARWRCGYAVRRGYASESFAFDFGSRLLEDAGREPRPVVVLDLGDHDPSGVDAARDVGSKIQRFADPVPVTFERVAVTPEQIVSMGLPTRPTKGSDARAARFEGESVEVDAIRAGTLRDLLDAAIKAHIDLPVWNDSLDREDDERAEIRRRIAA